MSKLKVILAIFSRNYLEFFTGVLGYLFIVVFVFIGALLTFQPQFFTDNLATLDHLSNWFPSVLLFIVPAMTMTAWADEQKLGTDELLFTLPVSDRSILLGKFLAVLAIFTTALWFTFPYLMVLSILGDPDWGVVATTYLGYWLAGSALLSCGLFASSLTSNTTVAFVAGATICAIPVFIGEIPFWNDLFYRLSVSENLKDFTSGVISLSSVGYFVSLTLFFLYLNLVVITRRHWSADQEVKMGTQYGVRAICLAVTLVCLNVALQPLSFRWDWTAEKIYSLSDVTTQTLDNVSEKNPITIQAFVSAQVPRDYVAVKNRFLGLLREYDNLGGSLVDVRVVSVEPFSQEAEEASHFDLATRRVQDERDGRYSTQNVVMGAVITSSHDEVVLPFVDVGTPIEYELTAAIHTVNEEDRIRVGIVQGDAAVLQESSEWQFVTKLRQTYEVSLATPESLSKPEAAKNYDVLIAVMPSSLTAPEVQHLVKYIKAGNPTLIFDDPFPHMYYSREGLSVAPRLPKRPSSDPMQRRQAPPQKADEGQALTLLNALKIGWGYDQVVTDPFNPHRELLDIVPREYVFVSTANGVDSAFSQKHPVTSGMQEMMLIHSGTVQPMENSPYQFEPLLRSGKSSGILEWDEVTRDLSAFFPQGFGVGPRIVLNPQPPAKTDKYSHVLAAEISNDANPKLKTIFVADLDLIFDFIVNERERNQYNLNLDNVSFLLNAIDYLAGQTKYLELRKRRAENRTLIFFEQLIQSIEDRRIAEQKEVEQEATSFIEKIENQFKEQEKEIRENASLDGKTRDLQLAQLQAKRNRIVSVTRKNAEQEKSQKKEKIKAQTEGAIRNLEHRIQSWVLFLTPLPALLMGIIVLFNRWYQERKQISGDRRVTATVQKKSIQNQSA